MVNIIAELGINHNGDLQLLKRMAKEATIAGADFVKIQKRTISWCYTEEELSKPCPGPWGETVGDKVQARELDWDQVQEFAKFCKEEGIKWGCSCFDVRSLKELAFFFGKEAAFFKVPSAMAIYPERRRFLEASAALGRRHEKPVLISAGLCRDDTELVGPPTSGPLN